MFWIGNLVPHNPRGNSPRYPLVIGEVDPERLQLIRDSVVTIDDRQPGESEDLTISSFLVQEDRVSGQILVHAPRMYQDLKGLWTCNAYLYRLQL